MTALYNIRHEQLQKANEGAADPLSEAVDWETGGRVKTASLGEMLFDFREAVRSGKRLLKKGSDDKEYSGWEWAWQLVNAGRIMPAANQGCALRCGFEKK